VCAIPRSCLLVSRCPQGSVVPHGRIIAHVHLEGAVVAETIVQALSLTKHFTRGQVDVVALERVDLSVPRGEFVALMGPSGSGKSTLLHLIAGMDKPTDGRLIVLDEEPAGMSERALARWRNNHIGFVFQSFNLIPVLTAQENVELPLKLTSLSRARRHEMATTALKLVGLEDRMDHFPRQLSGGQEQRVAIARAIVTDPDIILADEPTGNLDATSARDVLSLLQKLNKDFGKTIVMVTHDPHSAAAASRLIHLDKGKFIDAEPVPAIPVAV
jgi:putative ABC transport system ATP-binding protein